MTISAVFAIILCVEREWRNRQTRTFEGRVGRLVRVQVPSLAPRKQVSIWMSVFFFVSSQFPVVKPKISIFDLLFRSAEIGLVRHRSEQTANTQRTSSEQNQSGTDDKINPTSLLKVVLSRLLSIFLKARKSLLTVGTAKQKVFLLLFAIQQEYWKILY